MVNVLFSQREEAQAALRQNEQLLASIADNISEAIYRSDPGRRLTFVNGAYLRMFGYSSLRELQSIAREQLYADPQQRANLLALLQRNGRFSHQEVEYVRKGGSHFWGLTSACLIRDPESGEVQYQVGAITDITESRVAEAEIRRLNLSLEKRIAERTAELSASEARFRALVEHAPEAIVVFDGQTGRFHFGNSHACRLFGVTAEQFSKLTPADVSPEFQPGGQRSDDYAREQMRAGLAGNISVFEWLHRHRSGRLIPTEVRLLRLPSEDGHLLRASIIDNTERRRRELIQQATFEISQAVHTTEDLDSLYRRIHSIVKGLMPADNLYIALKDPGGKTFSLPYLEDEFFSCTGPLPVGAGLTGYVLREGKPLLAGPHNAVVPGSNLEYYTQDHERVTAIPCGNGSALWLGAPLSIRGETFGVIAVQHYRDPHAYGKQEMQILTFVAGQIALAIDRKRAEQALRESEEKYRALFSGSSQGVMLHDHKQYLEVNPAAARILGYSSQEELLGLHPRDTSPPFQPGGQASEELAAGYMAECVAKGQVRFDWTGRTAQGKDIPLEVALTRIEWCGKRVIQAFISDITQRKQAEAELLRALAREKELGQLKTNFVSMVSHEFRTPLGVILSSAEILDAYLEKLEPTERRQHLDSIRKNTRRMADLMEEVLLLGMVDAGKMDFKPALLDLQVFCRRIVEEVTAATEAKCPVRLTLAEGCADGFGDERLLRHIYGNLLSNAVKYSSHGRPVEFALTRQGTDCLAVIRDYGRGIPPEDLNWLFNAFHRASNARDLPGTGLGLTIVKRCVELHDGWVGVASRLGEGTTVTVRLPLFKSTPCLEELALHI